MRPIFHFKGEVLYTDECCFTRQSLAKGEWTQKRSNVEVDMALLNDQSYALLLAVSAERGVVCSKIYKRSVNVEKCLDWVEQLREENPGRKLCVFWDNLSVHHSKRVLGRLEDLGIKVIFNISYSPQFNGVEGCFSKVKHTFKKERLQKLARGLRPNLHTLVHRAVKSLRLEDI